MSMNENHSMPAGGDTPNVDALLNAAQQAGTPSELAGMSAMVQQFTAAITAPVVDTPAPIAARSRFAGRITKRAALMAGLGVFVAGTAAAAAGGVLPSAITAPFHAPRAEVLSGADTSVPNSQATTTVAGSAPVTTAVTGSTLFGDDANESDDQGEGTEHSSRLFGLCTAWTDGVAKDPTLKPFHDLAEAASAQSQTVEQFCADVLANPPASSLPAESDDDQGDDHGAAHDAHHDADGDHGSVPPITLPGQTDQHGRGHHDHGPIPTTTVTTTAPTTTAPGA